MVLPACALAVAGSVAGSAVAPTQGPSAVLAVAPHASTPPASVTAVSGGLPANVPGNVAGSILGSTPIVAQPYPAATVVPTGTGQARVAAAPQLEPVSPIATLLPVLQSAYAVAAAGTPSSCHLPVSLLAAIGQVESGSLRGRHLDAAHRVSPPLYGPLLDGHGFAALTDTDGGTLDGSARWDRAVGPMQFIPQTWRAFGVDGDGDGVRDPQDVEDAAASAALYLCHGGGDLSDPAQLRASVFSYNHSDAYYRLVSAWMQHFDAVPTGFSTATFSAPALAAAATVPAGFHVAKPHARSRHHHRHHGRHGHHAHARHHSHGPGATTGGHSSSPGATPAGASGGTPSGPVDPPASGGPKPTPSSTPTAVPSPVSTPPAPSPTSASPSPSPSCPPAPVTDSPTPVATAPADPASPGTGAASTPAPAPVPSAAPAPVPSGCPVP